MTKRLLLLLLPPLAIAASAQDPAPAARQAIENWLAFQRSVRTVEADFVQSRELRILRNPLRSEGKVWIDRRGDRFRWQAGDADNPQSIAVRSGDTLTLMQPSRKRAETKALTRAAAASQGGGSEAAFDIATGDLPATYESLIRQFSVLDAKLDGNEWRIRLSPKEARLREAVAEITFLVDAAKHHLRGFALTFRDGSKVQTTFTRQRFNAPLDDTLFTPDLTGYSLR